MVSVAQLDSVPRGRVSVKDAIRDEVVSAGFSIDKLLLASSPLQARTKKKSAIKKISLRNIKSKKPKRKVKSK